MEEILRSPVEVGSVSHYLRRVLAPSQVVRNGISEPSTVCIYPNNLTIWGFAILRSQGFYKLDFD